MTQRRARLSIEEEADVAVVTFNETRILDQIAIREIQAEFETLVGEIGRHHLLVDFDGVEALSSSALGVLVALNDRLRALGGRLKLAGLKDDIARLLALTRLDRVLEVHPDRETALASFRRR